jgi:cytochrome c-type biogenesis protein CcmH
MTWSGNSCMTSRARAPRSAPAAPGTAPMTALFLALALPAFAIGLYLAIGDSAIIPRLEGVAGETAQAKGHGAADAQQAASLEIMVERLAARMEENPDQLEGWLMLGRTYVALDQPTKGAAALSRALALAPQNPEVMINLAQALATAANGQLGGRPAELIAAALVIEPKHATGRWLNGLVAYQAGEFPLAVKRWEALALDLDAADEDATELRQFIADAREQGGLPPASTPTPPAVAPVATTAAASPAPQLAPMPSQPPPPTRARPSRSRSPWRNPSSPRSMPTRASSSMPRPPLARPCPWPSNACGSPICPSPSP